jgi:hypothetical protein
MWLVAFFRWPTTNDEELQYANPDDRNSNFKVSNICKLLEHKYRIMLKIDGENWNQSGVRNL